uniref:OPT family small oligopeptide transporter n=1 Tax=Bionectria ochroleuca TaxID=29856 RepID=A0A8H7N1U6_BIOOC
MGANAQEVTVDERSAQPESKAEGRDSTVSSIEEAKRPSEESEDAAAEVLQAAGVGFRKDDPSLPCLTVRMWVLAIIACLIGTGINTLFTFRLPSITLSQSAIQFIAYPVGKAWEYVVPDWGVTLFGRRHSLNPGPFNYKENILIYIMANLSFATRLSADVLTEQRVFYGLKLGWGFELVVTFVTILFGFSIAGLSRSIITDPKTLTWPGVLGNTALNAALHSTNDKDDETTGSQWKASRYKFFLIAAAISFGWYWFPDFLFPALGYFTWVCWIAPKNAVVNQVFGMKSGIGLLPFTFDWAQIAYTGSPLVVPTWAILNILASLVFWIYIISPALYYSNTWSFAYFPIQSTDIFDNMGKSYNVTKVVNKADDFTLDYEKYKEYSDIYLPTTYALTKFGLSFACISSLFVWLLLEKRKDIMKAIESSDVLRLFKKGDVERESPQPGYKSVPTWWYLVTLAISVGLGIFVSEYYPVQLRWYGAILAFVVSAVFFIPLALICAATDLHVSIDVFCRIIAGYIWEGKVLANIWFFDLGYITGIKDPPRDLFIVQAVGIVISTLSQVSVVNWALEHIPNICTNKAANVWYGVHWVLEDSLRLVLSTARFWFFLVGALLPVTVFLVKKKFGKSRWIQKIHVPVFLGGLNYIPPASGTNYGSWAIVGLIFGWWVKRHSRKWWMKYNFVLSSALDCSLAIAGIVIFFTVFYTGAADNFNWWGTSVYKNTCDWKGCPYKAVETGHKIGEL